MRKPLLIITLVVMAFNFGCTQAHQEGAAGQKQEAFWLDGLWPHEKSALPRHDKALYGRLDNGLRYIIQRNSKPEKQVTVQLNVQIGSLMEREDELGLAHFLEHMAFNGSNNFPPGTLIPFFQKNGMAFGRDANAHTAFHETIYKLALASNEHGNMAQGLSILRDIADGLSILPEEVDKERGVVLSEKAARDSEQFRAACRQRDMQFAGTRMTIPPIGKEEVIKHATADTIRGFYDAWYRPEYMVLVVVGDVKPADVEQLITEKFGTLAAHGERREPAWWGDTHHQGLRTYYDKYDTESTSVGIWSVKPRVWANDSETVQREMLYKIMANSIVAKRLQRLRAEGKAPFIGAMSMGKDMFMLYPVAAMVGRCEADKWEPTMKVLQDELNRALKHGFLEDELHEVCEETLRTFKLKVQTEHSQTNDQIAETIVGCLNANRVYQSWKQTYDMYERFINEATVGALNTAFRGQWSADNRLLTVTGNADIEGDAAAKLVELWEDGTKRVVAEPVGPAPIQFPYVATPRQPGARKSATVTPIPGSDLSMHEVTFANGFRLRMIPTDFDPGQIALTLQIGGGLDSIDDAHYLNAVLAVRADKQSGIGNLTAAEQMRLFRRQGFTVKNDLRSDAYTMAGAAPNDEVPAMLQAFWTQFKDPTFTPEDRDMMLRNMGIADEGRYKTVPASMGIFGRHFFFGESLRNTPITAPQAKDVSIENLRTALKAVMAGGGGILNAVGDFDMAELEKQTAALFGSPELAWKPAAPRTHAHTPIFPAMDDRDRSFTVDSHLGQAALRVAVKRPLKDVSDRKTLMTRRMLSMILRDRLRESIREELGVSYSPGCVYWLNDKTGFGIYMVRIGTQPDKIELLKKAVAAAMEDIRSGGVEQEELDRMRRPMLAAWKRYRTMNAPLMKRLVLTGRRDKPYFLWDAKLPEYLDAVTVKGLNKEARAAFTAANTATITGTEKTATN